MICSTLDVLEKEDFATFKRYSQLSIASFLQALNFSDEECKKIDEEVRMSIHHDCLDFLNSRSFMELKKVKPLMLYMKKTSIES